MESVFNGDDSGDGGICFAGIQFEFGVEFVLLELRSFAFVHLMYDGEGRNETYNKDNKL